MSQLPTTESETLGHPVDGWAGIERHLVKHDTSKVKNYADDIDTLLVFAGLFSAVLTAFVVQTYELLQPSNDGVTNQLLAYGIFTQMSQTEIPQAINATISKYLTRSSSFVPSASARWINALFFISLILSLSAALFGILAKQWLREYMLWHSPFGTPRENVLMRQIRFEAWEAWNVAATITSIPALLELAMILFFAGSTILLWTLDNIVAISATAVIAIFFGVVTSFTTMPIFHKGCPYKSPTSWALVTLTDAIASLFVYILRLCRSIWNTLLEYYPTLTFEECLRMARRPQYPTPPKSWRERDRLSCGAILSIFSGLKDRDARRLAKEELAKESMHLMGDGGTSEDPLYPHRTSPEAATVLLADITETFLLLKALSWVSKASQDVQISGCVSQCIRSLHPAVPESPNPFDVLGVRVVTDWSIISLLWNQKLSPPTALPLTLPTENDTRIIRVRRTLSCRTRRHAPTLRRRVGEKTGYTFYREGSGSWEIWLDHFVQLKMNGSFSLLPALLASDFTQAATNAYGGASNSVNIRRVVELLFVLQDIPLEHRPPGEHYLEGLKLVLGDCARGESSKIPSTFTGLRYQAFLLASRWCRVSVCPCLGVKHFVLSEGKMSLSDYTALLFDYFSTLPDTESDQDTFEMFIATTIGWLQAMQQSSGPSEVIQWITKKMVDMAQICASEDYMRICDKHSDDAAWIFGLWQNMHILTRRHCAHQFRRLLHIFEKGYQHHRLIGDADSIQPHLHWILEAAHEGISQCEDMDCRWIGHGCKSWDCPLLPIYSSKAP